MSRGGGEGEGRRAPAGATGSEREREAASIWIEERAGGRELREARSVVGSSIRWSGWKGGVDQIWLAGG